MSRSLAYLSSSPTKAYNAYDESNKDDSSSRGLREIKIVSYGEVSLVPDRVEVMYTVRSSKENPNDANSSVQRRIEYIDHTLLSNGVKKEDIVKHSWLHRTDTGYQGVTEVVVTFPNVSSFASSQYERMTTLLVEKLGAILHVSEPHFFHSQEQKENVRRVASLKALKNAKLKAMEIASIFGQSLGKLVCVVEDDIEEWEGPKSGEESALLASIDGQFSTIQNLILRKTLHVSAKMTVSFEIRNPPKPQKKR